MFFLFVWMTVTAGSGYSASYREPYNGWVNLGEFTSHKSCEEAGTSLGYNASAFRCIRK
jgi:hypothetical protein